MKILIIEGTDNVGKDTVINHIAKNYNNTQIIHSQKPKENTPEKQFLEQQNTFYRLAINNQIDYIDKKYDMIIHNRSWYGEYVYGCLYRNADETAVKKMISLCEVNLLYNVNPEDVCFIMLLSSSSDFLMRNEDGLSISEGKCDLIEKETKRFREIFNYSSIPNKHIVYVNDGNKFRDKEDIYNEIMKHIYNGKEI